MRENFLIILILCIVFGFLYIIGLGVINYIHLFNPTLDLQAYENYL